jgi:hypothetical protein
MIQLYKPNSKNGGCAFSFRFGTSGKFKDPCLYVNAIMQHSWNEKTKNGSFSENVKNPEKTAIIKLNEFEVGGIINAIENYCEYKAFHSHETNKTAISFKPYVKSDGSKAFSFSITKNSALKFGIGIEPGEAYAIREFCKMILQKLYETRSNAQMQNRSDEQ